MLAKICKVIVIIALNCFIFFNSYALPAPLPVNQAFALHVSINQAHQLMAEWDISPSYFLYRDKIKFVTGANSPVQVGTIFMPSGQPMKDDLHGSYQIYTQKIKISVPLLNVEKKIVDLDIVYQGCSDFGFCYAPVTKHLKLNLSTLTTNKDLTRDISSAKKTIPVENGITKIFVGHSFFFALLTFLGLGLLLAFTPCVLPMVPILSGIIVNHSKKNETNASRAFFLSLFYVLGMALTYMILGVIVALLGSSVQAYMQKPWVIILFSTFFVFLALSLFGIYTLQFPASWQRSLMKWDKHFKHGAYTSVFFMGIFSSLIVSPCVSAPLVGVLAYIGETGNIIFGASALFALALGMGLPLLLVGTSAAKLLPRSGPWMVSVQKIFGILMLGVAIALFSRLISEHATMLLWAALLFISAIMLGAFETAIGLWAKVLKIIGIAIFIYGIILVTSVALKNPNPSRPWEIFYAQDFHCNSLSFSVLKNMEQLDHELAIAKQDKKPVLLDFYADWCVSCKKIDKDIFENQEVQNALKNYVLLRADITKLTEFDQELLKRFQIIGPPTILFFNQNGGLDSRRFVGEFTKEKFVQHLQEVSS